MATRAKHSGAVKRRRRHESLTKARNRLNAILDELRPLYAGLGTALNFDTPLQLLVATILSAQCTDDRVNMVTPELFRQYPDAAALAEADPSEIERLIYTTGFFRNKTRHIQAASRVLVERFQERVPETMAELIQLPGVDRKTANVVLSHAFGKAEGIAVDTHVFRLSRRLDLSRAANPAGVEQDLMAISDPSRWTEIADSFIWHGRRICQARKPMCLDCVVLELCPAGRKNVGLIAGVTR
ncbi:MAG TPA: endonuclease III [Chloroflexota bacterium]|nr:endonuclease III [Chloroflexota bacterium]